MKNSVLKHDVSIKNFLFRLMNLVSELRQKGGINQGRKISCFIFTLEKPFSKRKQWTVKFGESQPDFV
jgi:hypothetical protein